MLAAVTLILSFSLGIALGSDCRDISGVWQNQHGSNMTIFRRSENQITGEYSTAVESEHRAALVSSNITGTYTTVNGGALLSFTVLFNHGKSLTTWVGQCMVCDGEETLFMTWNLRTRFLKVQDRWMSSRVGQDTFKRTPGGYNDVPFHLRTLGPLPKDETSSDCEKNIGASGRGQWISSSDDVLHFTSCFSSGIHSGLNKGAHIYGRLNGGTNFTALGFSTTTTTAAKGWTGYIYENSLPKRTIEAAWFSHSFSNSCKQPRSLVSFGTEEFSFSHSKEASVAETSAINRFWSYVTSLFGGR